MSASECLHRLGRALSAQAFWLQREIGNVRLHSADRTSRCASLAPPSPAPEIRRAYLREADEILQRGPCLFAGRRFALGAVPQWNRDPLTGVLAPPLPASRIRVSDRAAVGDIKHVWELNRHLHLVRLAQAYALGRQRDYLLAIGAQLESWFEQCRPFVGPNWASALEAGIRLINWSVVWRLIGCAASELFAGTQGALLRQAWVASVHAHCAFIRRNLSGHSSANNHLMGELAGLYVAARTWPCWDEAPAWGDEAKAGLEREAVLQYFQDGVHKEQALSYQLFTTELMLIAGVWSAQAKDSFSGRYWDAVAASIDFVQAVRDAGGHLPMTGDADDAVAARLAADGKEDRVEAVLRLGAKALGRAAPGEPGAAARWLGLQETIAHRPAKAGKWAFPHGGYYLFGSDFGGPREIKGMVDCGPLGYLGIAAHGHADALAITLSVAGRPVLVDPGTYSYWSNARLRDYFRGTSAHNTVAVDGLDQSVGAGRFMWTRKAAVTLERAPQAPGDFRLVASHDGYLRLADPVRHRRTVSFDAPLRRLTVADELEAGSPHRSEQFWHFAPDVHVEVSGSRVQARAGDAVVYIAFSGSPAEVCLIRGDHALPLGWYSGSYESLQPTSVLRVTAHGRATSLEARFTFETGATPIH